MKIISWNCRGRFREKFHVIQKENADIYVIQECENPDRYPANFDGFPYRYIWYGEKEQKGLAVFYREEISVIKNEWPTYCLRHFISVRINEKIDLIGVWASKPYIEEYYIYQSINIDKYGKNTILIGDFNSNAIWDNEHDERNHSTVVEELKKIGLESAYHYVTGEQQGRESVNTFYLYKHLDRPYHIDHCFLHPSRLEKYEIMTAKEWLMLSDHNPICVWVKE